MEFAQLQALVEQVLEDNKLTKAEMQQIVAGITEDGKISPEEKALMETLKTKVLRHEIQVVD